jgi:excisionase family DNA binding protein
MQEIEMQLSEFQDKYGLTVNEAVKVIGICERKIRDLIAKDEIPHYRVGRAVRIPWQPLKEWMDNGGTGGDKR